MADPKIIVALDLDSEQQALHVIEKLNPAFCRLKVGKCLFTTLGPQFVRQLQARGFEVFLDLKFHDIPFQVASSCVEAAKLGVWMTNVHALGGRRMMQSAKEAVDHYAQSTGHKMLLIGVTLLTSHSQAELADIGLAGSIESHVLRLAGLCHQAGLDGVVCSAQEATQIKQAYGSQFICVTPGIRLADQNHHDQVRVLTPTAAIQAGSDYLVMGRSILESDQPSLLLEQIISDIKIKHIKLERMNIEGI